MMHLILVPLHLRPAVVAVIIATILETHAVARLMAKPTRVVPTASALAKTALVGTATTMWRTAKPVTVANKSTVLLVLLLQAWIWIWRTATTILNHGIVDVDVTLHLPNSGVH